MALAASPPTHRAAHTHAVTISDSPPLMRSNAAPRGILGDFTNSNIYSLLRPCTKRAVDAARRLLYLAALPSEVACSTLSEATSLCERIQGDLRSLFSRRDTPLDDATYRALRLILNKLYHPQRPRTHSQPPLLTPPDIKEWRAPQARRTVRPLHWRLTPDAPGTSIIDEISYKISDRATIPSRGLEGSRGAV